LILSVTFRNTTMKSAQLEEFVKAPRVFLREHVLTQCDLVKLSGMICGKKDRKFALKLGLYLLEYCQVDDCQLPLPIKRMVMHLVRDCPMDATLASYVEEVTMTPFWAQNVQDLIVQLLDGSSNNEDLMTQGIRFYCTNNEYTMGKELFARLVEAGYTPHIRTFLPLLEKSPNTTELENWHRLACDGDTTRSPSQDFYEVYFSRLLECLSGREKHERDTIFLQAFNQFREHCMYVSSPIKKIFEQYWQLDRVVIRPDGQVSVTNTSSAVQEECSPRLEQYDISDAVRKRFKESPPLFSKRMEEFDKEMCQRGFTWDVVLDGANIALYNNSKFQPDRLFRLARWAMKQKKWKILLILHVKRRQKSIDQFVKKNRDWIQVYYTPIGFNDDHYWIYAALSHSDCYFITNDEMRDHLWHNFSGEDRKLFKIWKERHRIIYHPRGVICPPSYSRQIQVQKKAGEHTAIYLPIYDSDVREDDHYLQNLDKIQEWRRFILSI